MQVPSVDPGVLKKYFKATFCKYKRYISRLLSLLKELIFRKTTSAQFGMLIKPNGHGVSINRI